MPTITVKLSESDAELLEQLRGDGKSKSDVIRELLRNHNEVIKGNTEKDPVKDENNTKVIIEVLRGQLDQKDAHIANQDKHIADLTEAVKEANKATRDVSEAVKAAQTLHMTDKQPAMLEASNQKPSWTERVKAWFRD